MALNLLIHCSTKAFTHHHFRLVVSRSNNRGQGQLQKKIAIPIPSTAFFTTNTFRNTSLSSSTSEQQQDQQKGKEGKEEQKEEEQIRRRNGKPQWDNDLSPWSPKNISRQPGTGVSKSRFRQHVNPLAQKFQMQTELPDDWPNDGNSFSDASLPLHIDIGCGKGGFLLDLATKRLLNPNNNDEHEKRNYLGLEIRPSVAQYAKERVDKWNLSGSLDFIGCNANVDLDRILTKYTTSSNGGKVRYVSIQYPDPHFKKSHQKRRVVTSELVSTLAKFLVEDGELFLQSDIQEVHDLMRFTVREEGSEYFEDRLDGMDEYLVENPLGVPTERELSVLDQGLDVYRSIFRRNAKPYTESD